MRYVKITLVLLVLWCVFVPRNVLADESALSQYGLFGRLAQVYVDGFNPPPTAGDSGASGPAYRGLPAPLDSPPFPSADYPLGGSPVIGAPYTYVPPLMQAIYDGPNGDAIKASRVQVYGWVQPSFNASTSRHSNYPVTYDVYPNRLQLDQAVVYIERVPDSVQTDHVDWGFRIANLYGENYRFTTMNGVLSDQLLKNNHRAGYDPVMAYGDLYIPQVAEGMNVRLGRFISVPDIEAQLAPNNYMYTHSLLYSIDPYTDIGMMTTTKLNDQWMYQIGVTAGHDTAPWTTSAQASLTTCLRWTSKDNNDSLYPCVNGINGGDYAYNNLQMFVNTWSHRFNDRWHMETEAWYMYQNKVPNLNNPDAPALIVGANGAFCKPGQTTCFAPEYAAVNYLQYKLSDYNKDYISLRNDMLNDERGQRTGYATVYTESTLAYVRYLSDQVLVRPELRFDHSYARAAYDGGTSRNQATFATDMIINF
jgi:hypothetical protein